MNFDLLSPAQLAQAFLPEIVLIAGAIGLMLYASWRSESLQHQRNVGYAAIAVLVATLAAVAYMVARADTSFPGIIATDPLRWSVDVVVLLATMGTVLLSIEHNERQGIAHAEMHVLVCFAAAGAMVLAAGRDLMLIFLGVEIMSVAVYVLAGMNRRSPKAAEASLKYFLLGAFATGFLLYGMALIYGATGSTHLAVIAQRILDFALLRNPMLLIGVGLLTIGLAFKVAAAPFHMWAPDVYEGAPTPITAFMAAAVKAAAFAGIARIWFESFQELVVGWAPVFWGIAVVSMVVGNVVALRQRNIKRMLAYSSIVHSGYLLVTVLANTSLGSASLIFYVLAYTLATFGAFAIVSVVQGSSGDRGVDIADYNGLWHTRPLLAVGMSVFLLALLGFPVFGGLGFFAKWYVVSAALSSPYNLNSIAVILVVTSVISAGYYLQVVRAMFMQPRNEGAVAIEPSGPLTKMVLVGTAVAILVFGVIPGGLATWASGGKVPPVNTENVALKVIKPGD